MGEIPSPSASLANVAGEGRFRPFSTSRMYAGPTPIILANCVLVIWRALRILVKTRPNSRSEVAGSALVDSADASCDDRSLA